MAEKRLIDKVREGEVKWVKKDETNAPELDATPRFGNLTHHLLKLGTPTTDSDYQKRWYEASDPTEKGRVLVEYSERYPDLFSKSLWAKTAVAGAPHMQVSTSLPNSDRETIGRGAIAQQNPEVSAQGIPPITDFKHSPDFRTVALNGRSYKLTSKQAQVIELLYKAYENGTPELGQAYILEQLGERGNRLRDTFKRNPEAWQALVARGVRRGCYRLNLPNPARPSHI